MEQSYTRNAKDVLKHFDVTERQGLSSQRVRDNRKRYGNNCEQHILYPCGADTDSDSDS